MDIKTIREANIKGKRVLVRCGFDAPLDSNGEIKDDSRIRSCLKTLNYLIAGGAKVIICSHNGRPGGRIVPRLSMDKTAVRLSGLLGKKVDKLDDCIGPKVERKVGYMTNGEIILLENLRFNPGEKGNDPTFAKKLSSLGDIYVNEAFSNSHRQHASMIGVPNFLPAYAGFRLKEEIKALSGILDLPTRPLVAVVGGAKISDKILVIRKFIEKADHVLLGGALANTILKAKGVSIGKSVTEESMMEVAASLPLTTTKLHVPVDVVVAKKISPEARTEKKAVGSVGDDELILDIGPDTIKLFSMILRKAGSIIWGGPMGYFEIKSFAKGSLEIAQVISKARAYSLAGGGDTLEVLSLAGCRDKISFVSTGGGAMLEFLGTNSLPALKKLIKGN